MFSNTFGRIAFGLCAEVVPQCCSGLEIPHTVIAVRTALSWSLTCRHRARYMGRPAGRSLNRSSGSSVMGPRIQGLRSASQTTVDPVEVKKFQLLANKWWDERGEFAALHSMNDLRVPFIRDNLLNRHGGRQQGRPLAGLKLLDVGCGGGLLTEPLGRLGADVLGVDPVEDSIRTAELHASFDPAVRDSVRYRSLTLEELSEEVQEETGGGGRFDGVVASEVVEHLADLETFAICCHQVLKPGGSIFITTINKTEVSYALAVVAAERILGLLPRGTHDWDKFISPVELERLLESNGFNVESVRGMLFNPLSRAWCWTQNTSVNYALHAIKQ